ncbi:MAG: TonB-dependent receptor [Gammaproteobacteria bacterium]|nr:TonB-dependent receptor [Gammaproteobacteria bacterium]
MVVGVQGDRGGVVFSLGYSNQEEMKQAERPWATDALYPQLQPDGEFELVGSGSSNSRRIRLGADQYIVDEQTGVARPFTSNDVYNYAPVNALIQPNERWQFGVLGHSDFTNDVEAYMEAIYTRRTSQQRLAPDASFAANPTVDTPNNGPQWNDFVPASNPFNPFGANATGPDGVLGTGDDLNMEGIENQDVRINRRFVESGGRLFRQTNDIYRLTGGMRGDIRGISWDVSYTYAEAETLDETLNYGRFDRWATAVDPAACSADSSCPGVLNPFGPFGSITQEQMNYISTGSLKDLYSSTMEMVSVHLSGDMMQLAGGAAGWAAGFETRHEAGQFSPDEFLASGLTTSGASDPSGGDFSVEEVFGEVYLPFSADFTANASARYSDYDTSAGSSTTFKVGADYAVLDSLRLRATYATGFRAPNITELNQGEAGGFPIAVSLCEFGDRALGAGEISQTVYDNCQDLGVDTSDAGEFGFAWQALYTTFAPSAPLEPEESDSYNLGFVYESKMFSGLQVSVDYWNIEIDNVIGAPDYNDLYQTCMKSTDFSSPACDAFPDGPHNTAIYSVFPADAEAAFGNLGTLSTDGYDIDVRYNGSLKMGLMNGYDISWSATYQESYEREYPLTGSRDLAGTANGFEVFPEWRWRGRAGVYGNNWTLAYKLRFIGEAQDALRAPSITADATAEDILYHDIVGTYDWKNFTFSLGINNATDEDPPYFHSAFNANTEPGMYDVIGRRVFANVKASF